jgi:hypothetical protein
VDAESQAEGELARDVTLRLLAEGRPVTVRVASGSMEPTLARGDRVVVERRAPSVGDVVLIRGAREFVLHRLVARIAIPGYRRFVHRGDAPRSRPALCRAEEIAGVAATPPRIQDPGSWILEITRALTDAIAARARCR